MINQIRIMPYNEINNFLEPVDFISSFDHDDSVAVIVLSLVRVAETEFANGNGGFVHVQSVGCSAQALNASIGKRNGPRPLKRTTGMPLFVEAYFFTARFARRRIVIGWISR